MALDFSGDFSGDFAVSAANSDQVDAPATEIPDNSITIYMGSCVSEFEDYDGSYPETFISYGYTLNFATPQDLEAFKNHPKRPEIENTIRQSVKGVVTVSPYAGELSDLEREILRDSDPENFDLPTYGESERFTDSSLTDMAIATENIVPEINATYNLNIELGNIAEQTHEVPNSCIHPPDFYETAEAPANNSGSGLLPPPMMGG